MARRRVPDTEAKFLPWIKNFALNLPSVANALNVAPNEVARIINDAQVYEYIVDFNTYIRAFKDDNSKVKTRLFDYSSLDSQPVVIPIYMPPNPPVSITYNVGIEDFANRLVQGFIKKAACTPEIQALLQIELTDDVEDDEIKPVIKSSTANNGGAVEIRASLDGYKAYRLFCQRGANPDFVHVLDSTEVTCVDSRPNAVPGQPETRSYKVILLEKNQPVGDYSDIREVVTKP